MEKVKSSTTLYLHDSFNQAPSLLQPKEQEGAEPNIPDAVKRAIKKRFIYLPLSLDGGGT